MRPLLLVTVDWPPIEGGIASVATGLARGLVACGESVVVVAPRLGPRELAAVPGVAVHRSPLYHLGPLRLAPLFAIATWATARYRPRALVALNPAYGGVFGAGLATFTGLPCLVYAYGYEFLRYRDSPLRSRLLRAVYARAHRVVAISQYVRERLVEFGVAREDIVVIPPAIDPLPATDVHGIRARLGIGPGRIVLTVARLIPRKGLVALARGLEHVARDQADLVWVLVGRGPELARLEALVAGGALRGRAHLLGYLPEPELDALYREAVLFALTPEERLDDVEGFGVVYLEAALRGLPSVATRAGGVPEAVIDGETGILVAPGDEAGLAAALRSLLDDSARRTRFGLQARLRAEATTWKDAAIRLIACLP